MSITYDDYYNFRFLKSFDISPDGRKVAYTLTKYIDNPDKDGFHKVEQTQIWLLDRDTGVSRQLTHGEADFNPSWSPDGHILAFNAKKGKNHQLFLLPMEGGEARQLTLIKQGVAAKAIWSPDGKSIATSIVKHEETIDSKKPYWLSRDFYRMDAVGIIDNILNELIVIDVESGEHKQLTDDEYHNTAPQWSPNGKKILYNKMFPNDSIMGIFPQPSVIDIESKEIVSVGDALIPYVSAWVDDSSIVFAAADQSKTYGSKNDLYLYNFSDNSQKNLTSDDFGVLGGLQGDAPTAEARLPAILVHEGFAYISVQRGGDVTIDKISLSEGSQVQFITGERANFPYSIIGDELFFSSSTMYNPLDIHMRDLKTNEEEQLTFTNKAFLDTKTLPEVKNLHFKGEDGADVEGWILLPPEGKNLPTLLNIHGGPHAGWGNLFVFENLYLVGLGYAVLMVNHRASTGYGDEFATAIHGDWGNLDYFDLMAGVDHAIEQGYSDPLKMGCFGISGGGNLSCWIVGQTDRFRAAIPENPVTNWQSFYGVSDIGRWFSVAELGGKPHEIPEVYEKCSPITYAHKCTTPTLLIQHDMDYRCPPEQSEQFYAVLRDAGCEVEMLRMPNSSHGGSALASLEIRETQNKAIVDWFGKYVLN